MKRLAPILCCLLLALPGAAQTVHTYRLAAGSQPQDVAPAQDGAVWYAAPGALGRLDPASGAIRIINLAAEARPAAIALGADALPWLADAGRNLILRVDPASETVAAHPLPKFHSQAELNALAFAGDGALWFTGMGGIYGRVMPASGKVEWYDAPFGRGPLGLATAQDGAIYFASAAQYVARIDPSGAGGWTLAYLAPPLPAGGVGGLALGPDGVVWITQPAAGALGRYDPVSRGWRQIRLPGAAAKPSAIHVEGGDVWVFDNAAGAFLRFEPRRERFTAYPVPPPAAAIGRLAGRAGEIWAADPRNDRLIALRFANPPRAP